MRKIYFSVAMIQKNRPACQKFANEQSLDDLMELVNITYLSHCNTYKLL